MCLDILSAHRQTTLTSAECSSWENKHRFTLVCFTGGTLPSHGCTDVWKTDVLSESRSVWVCMLLSLHSSLSRRWLVKPGHSSHTTVEQSDTHLCPYSDPASPSLSLRLSLSSSCSVFMSSSFCFLLLFLPTMFHVSCCLSSITLHSVFSPSLTLLIIVFFLPLPLSGTQGEQQRCGWMSIKTSTTLLSPQREMSLMESEYLKVLC